MDKAIIEKIKNYSEIISKKYPVEQVILYGSYAKGEEKEYSDIDIAIVFDELKTDYFRTTADLYRSATDIDYRMETFIIERKNDRSGFLDSILSYGKVIYKN